MDTRHSDLVLLVVDDEASIRQVLEEFLELELGARVLLAEDGRRALEIVDAEVPALILTDVRMPLVDGVDLIRELRAKLATRQVPIVVVAATGARRDEALAAGGDDYLDKPFDLDSLAAMVRRHLDRRDSRGLTGAEPGERGIPPAAR